MPTIAIIGALEKEVAQIKEELPLAQELKALKDEVPHYQEYIEKLSSYMASSGKQYSSHAATIRSWALRDHPAPVKRTYECKEDESL